jgi:hypothetical protein
MKRTPIYCQYITRLSLQIPGSVPDVFTGRNIFYCRVVEIMHLCNVLDVNCLKMDVNTVLNIVGVFFQASKNGGLTQ